MKTLKTWLYDTLFPVFSATLVLIMVACGGSSSGSSSDDLDDEEDISADSGGDSGDSGDSSDDSVPEDENHVVLLTNETSLEFGPINDAFAILVEDTESATRGLQIILTEDTTVRNICLDPSDTWVDGFSAITALFLFDLDNAWEGLFIRPTNENIIRDYEHFPQDYEPGAGIQSAASMGMYEDNEHLGGSDPEGEAANRVTITSANLTEEGRVVGDLSVMVFDDDGHELGLLDVEFDVPFACEVVGDLF